MENKVNVIISNQDETIITEQETVICLAVTRKDEQYEGKLICKGKVLPQHVAGRILKEIVRTIITDTADDKAEEAFMLYDLAKEMEGESRKTIKSMSEKEKRDACRYSMMQLMELWGKRS